jgi:hypothetical protein
MPPISKDTLLRYCVTIYEALEAGSKEVDGVRQWEGRYTELFAGLGISNAHYSKVSNTLQEIGAIEMLRRGARGTSTLIALHRKPEVSDLAGGVGTEPGHLTRPTALDTLTQRVSQLERRLDGVDLKAYIANTERRLLTLEGKQAKAGKRRSA